MVCLSIFDDQINFLYISPERAGTYLDIGADILNLLTRDAVASAVTRLGVRFQQRYRVKRDSPHWIFHYNSIGNIHGVMFLVLHFTTAG